MKKNKLTRKRCNFKIEEIKIIIEERGDNEKHIYKVEKK